MSSTCILLIENR